MCKKAGVCPLTLMTVARFNVKKKEKENEGIAENCISD